MGIRVRLSITGSFTFHILLKIIKKDNLFLSLSTKKTVHGKVPSCSVLVAVYWQGNATTHFPLLVYARFVCFLFFWLIWSIMQRIDLNSRNAPAAPTQILLKWHSLCLEISLVYFIFYMPRDQFFRKTFKNNFCNIGGF